VGLSNPLKKLMASGLELGTFGIVVQRLRHKSTSLDVKQLAITKVMFSYGSLGNTSKMRHRRHLNNIVQSSTISVSPWPLVRKRTIPTEPPPLVGEI
jgi:hypothetical protein